MPELSISISGLLSADGAPWTVRREVDPRQAIAFVASHTRHIQLDATLAGIRPRELDRSARRDLAALLRRLDLTLSGLDLWIPPEHFMDPARQGRAIEAAIAAIELAAELGPLVGGASRAAISMTLPDAIAPETQAALVAAAQHQGVRIADHRLGATATGPSIGVGLDPAAALLAGLDPAAVAAKLGRSLTAARLSDATTITRCLPGDPGARLDLLALRATLDVIGYSHAIVADLRGLPLDAQTRAAARWKSSLGN